MATKKFKKMEYGSADEMVFGESKYPLSYGLGLKVGSGAVIPEINFAPALAPRRPWRASGGNMSTT